MIKWKDNSAYFRGKRIGYIKDDNYIRLGNDPEDHRIHFPYEAWSVDVEVLQRLLAQGVTYVIIDGTGLRASVMNILTKGKPINRGHGDQIMLQEGYWNE